MSRAYLIGLRTLTDLFTNFDNLKFAIDKGKKARILNIGLQFLASGLSKSVRFSCAFHALFMYFSLALLGYSHCVNQKYELLRDH